MEGLNVSDKNTGGKDGSSSGSGTSKKPKPASKYLVWCALLPLVARKGNACRLRWTWLCLS